MSVLSLLSVMYNECNYTVDALQLYLYNLCLYFLGQCFFIHLLRCGSISTIVVTVVY